MSMKILYFIDAPRPGGATSQLYTLLKNLDKKEFTPLVAFGDFPELAPWVEDLKKLNISTLRTNLQSFNNFSAIKEFQRLFKSARPDIIHLHLCHSGSLRAAFLATRFSKAKVVVTEHDPFSLSPIKKRVKHLTLKFTDHTIAISESNRNFLTETYGIKGSKISRIYNGIDLTPYQKKQVSRNAVLGLDSQDFVITTVAELHKRKGLKYLIQAFREISQEDKNSKLVIVGTGPERGELEKLVKKLELENKVKFLGFRKDVPDILQASDLFVLPSIREAFGLAVLEAMASKVPVIASAVGGIKEILTPESGLLVEAKQVDKLVEAIKKLKSDPKLRSDLAGKAYERVEKEFSAEAMTQATEVVYKKVSS